MIDHSIRWYKWRVLLVKECSKSLCKLSVILCQWAWLQVSWTTTAWTTWRTLHSLRHQLIYSKSVVMPFQLMFKRFICYFLNTLISKNPNLVNKFLFGFFSNLYVLWSSTKGGAARIHHNPKVSIYRKEFQPRRPPSYHEELALRRVRALKLHPDLFRYCILNIHSILSVMKSESSP